MFKYNSHHKIITVIILLIWSILHFSTKEKEPTYNNGQARSTGGVKNGKNHGHWVWYYHNGAKKMEGEFNNGKRVGVWITYDINGRKLTQAKYVNDQLNGEFIRWISLEKTQHQYYKNDELIHLDK